ncbi:MAG: NADH-quinone oxidoreductase subunit M [Phototrophicales bacterium]|nr:MAG: NADH-quinone oxidoreductase subunit M [Phototrophicales bacterium]
METQFAGILTAILGAPIVGAMIILLLDEKARDQVRWIAAFATGISLALGLLVFFTYNIDDGQDAASLHNDANLYVRESGTLRPALVEEVNGELVRITDENGLPLDRADLTELTERPSFNNVEIVYSGPIKFQFVDRIPWIGELGISYQLGVDGLTAAMVMLTGLASFAGVLISWSIEERPREFFAFFLLLTAGVYGVFLATDIFLMFFFYELAIFPMYLLIAGWGWVELREYASMKLTLYILIGSVIALVGVLVLYFAAGSFFRDNPELIPATSSGAYSFDFNHLYQAAQLGAYDQAGYLSSLGIDGLTIARFWFPFVFIGFGVLAGLFPFHNWSPDGHVAAPTAVSMIHAGVLMKLGAYAALRFGVQLMPDGARTHLPWIIFLALVNVVMGAFIAFRQRDFKYVIGFSSVSHMGLVSMGFATMNVTGMTGAGLQMFSHGVMTALFFSCVGMVYDRAHTRDLPSLGGFIKKMPIVGVAFILGGFVSMGMPGLSGFVAEFPILIGVWKGIPAEVLDKATTPLTGELANYYAYVVMAAVLGIILTAAYVLRVTAQVFFGEFDAEKYPEVEQRPLLIQDRVALLLLSFWLIIVGVQPQILTNLIENAVIPVADLLKYS